MFTFGVQKKNEEYRNLQVEVSIIVEGSSEACFVKFRSIICKVLLSEPSRKGN